MSGDLDTAQLRSAVQDAWNGQYTVDHFNHVLVRFQDALANPLKQLGSDASSRQQIQSMNVKLPGEVQNITLQSDVVAWILDFCDAVEVNEIEVLKLLLQAFRMNNDDRRRCESERETAISLYFNQRQDLLIALLDIVQIVEGDQEFSPELVRIIQSFLERLKDEGLVSNIIERLRTFSKLKLSIYTHQIDNEIRLFSLILFYIEINSGLDSKASPELNFPNTFALSALSEEISSSIPSVRLHQDHQQEVLAHCHSITTSIYIIFTTLLNAMMDSGASNLPTWSSTTLHSPLANSHKSFITLLKTDQQYQISDSEEIQRLVFNGFAGFGAFVQQLSSLNEVARVDICSILCKFLKHVFRRHLASVRTWKDPKGILVLLGSLVSDICKRSPTQIPAFWQCQELPILLHSLDQDTPPDSPGFSSYVDLIVALGDDEHCARSVQFISSAKNTNWHRVFDLFHRAVAPALKHEQTQTLLPLDVRILCDLSRLVQVLSRCGPTISSVSIQQFQVLETLFQMLACAFPIRLKSELFNTINCWVKGRPAEAGQVWDRLEGMQVLPTLSEMSSQSGRGLLYDLEEIEAREGCFPLTRSFISLLETLIKVTPALVLEKIGAPLRPPGISPYITYVRVYIFSKIGGRSYSDVNEKWKVAKASLNLLTLLASPEDPDSTGLEILESFVRSGSAEVRAIIELILTNPDPSALESALGLIYIVLSHESFLIDRITRSNQECLPLSVVLLRQPQTIATVCQFVGSTFSLSIQAYAVEIMTFLVRHDSSLIVRLLSSQHLIDLVRRQWASQLLYASSDYENQLKVEQGIIRVLKEITIWPSLSHALLGFDITSSSSDTRLTFASDSCLCAVIDLVDKPGFLEAAPDVAASGLNLICTLLENPVTSRTIFEYINLHRDSFLSNCLERLPLLSQKSASVLQRTSYFLQTAWLLKSIALDLHLRRGDRILDESSALSNLGLFNGHFSSSSSLILTLLDSFVPEISSDLPEFGGLDRQSCVALGKNVLMSCIDTDPGIVSKAQGSYTEFLWNVPKLCSAATRAGLNVSAVQKSALSFNATVRFISSLRLSSQAWAQLIEVWLLERDLSELDPTQLFDLLIAVLGKLSDPLRSQSSIFFASTALSLMVHIRAIASNSVVVVDHRIVQGILAGIVNNQNHQTRAHLCAVFYTYMDFMSKVENDKDCGGRGSEWALAQALTDLNLSPANLIQRICDHALSNTASIRALATAFLCAYPLDQLVPLLEQSSQLIRFIQGIHSSSDLHAAICPEPVNYHLILSFESHLLFLLHITQSGPGTRALIAADILSRLGECEFFNLRPQETPQSQYASGHPSALQKYMQLTIPYLRLIASILTALPQRYDVHDRVIDILLVRYLKPFNSIIQGSKSCPENIEAYHAATAIILCLVMGPVSSRSEVSTAVHFLLQQFSLQAIVFRSAVNEESIRTSDDYGPIIFALEITRDMVILCSYMVQRRLLVFDPNIDPKLDRQENDLLAFGNDGNLPLGTILYYLVPGALTLLRISTSKQSHLEQALANVDRHGNTKTPTLYEDANNALPHIQLSIALRNVQNGVQVSFIIIQNCLQIIYLSLQIFSSTTIESKQILEHIDRLKEVISQIDSTFSVDHTDDLIEKQLAKIRLELDLSYGKKPLLALPSVTPVLPLALDSR